MSQLTNNNTQSSLMFKFKDFDFPNHEFSCFRSAVFPEQVIHNEYHPRLVYKGANEKQDDM